MNLDSELELKQSAGCVSKCFGTFLKIRGGAIVPLQQQPTCVCFIRAVKYIFSVCPVISMSSCLAVNGYIGNLSYFFTLCIWLEVF